jgi:gliding motility-associated-like protein
MRFLLYYEYSLDDFTYQDSPVFTKLVSGIYKVYINDKHHCGKINKEVVLFYYPNFFTPNDDGANDYWQIPNSVYEPGMHIYIFDRYGKLMAGIDPRGPGWDGNYNGYQAPSTDYWFVVERANGKVYRGHFAMKR